MRDTNKELRLSQIVQLANDRGKISTGELAIILGVSEMTIRRDASVLQANNAIHRRHGYICSVQNSRNTETFTDPYDLHLASIRQLKEKEKIARYAASLIRPDDWIFIDNGTTTLRITSFLPTEYEYTVLCCNFELMAGLMKLPNVHLIMPGGYFNRADQTFSSQQSNEFIRTFRANKAFISASGIHKSLGITCINSHSLSNKRAFIESSAERILLVDSSKFDVVTANHFAELEDIDSVITDSGISKEWKKYLGGNNVKVTVV